MQAPQGQNNAIEPIGAGTHHAVCYMVVDMGTHESKYGPKRQLLIGWEVPKYRIEVDKVDKPRAIRHWYNFTMYKESDLCKAIEGWSAVQFPSQEKADAFDFEILLGKNCLLTTSVNKNRYDKVESIGCLMDGMGELKAENDFIYYSLDEHGADIPDCVYEKTAKKIRQCIELSEGAEDDTDQQQDCDNTGGSDEEREKAKQFAEDYDLEDEDNESDMPFN